MRHVFEMSEAQQLLLCQACEGRWVSLADPEALALLDGGLARWATRTAFVGLIQVTEAGEAAAQTIKAGKLAGDATDRARVLAEKLHAGQLDKVGAPYIGHLARVAGILVALWPDASAAEREAAWLHDALEDTDATAGSLIAAGVSNEAVEIVRAVTRPAGAAYLDWIGELALTAPLGALRVKLADNADNSDPFRVALLGDGGRRVEERYAPARAILLEGLCRRFGADAACGGLLDSN